MSQINRKFCSTIWLNGVRYHSAHEVGRTYWHCPWFAYRWNNLWRDRDGCKAIKIIRLYGSYCLVTGVLSTVYANQLHEKQILRYLLQFSSCQLPELEVWMRNWSKQQSLLSVFATEITQRPYVAEPLVQPCQQRCKSYESTAFSRCILSRAVATGCITYSHSPRNSISTSTNFASFRHSITLFIQSRTS